MPTNDFLPFATGGGANVQSQATYAADPQTPVGSQSGVARSAFVNKAIRQATYFISVLAGYIATKTGDNILDDTNSANLLASIAKAMAKPPNVVTLNVGSGTYTPTAGTKALKVRLQGAGAGGSGTPAIPDGSNGGDTIFGTTFLTAQGGFKGGIGGSPIVGGSFAGNGSVVRSSPGGNASAAHVAGQGSDGGGSALGVGACWGTASGASLGGGGNGGNATSAGTGGGGIGGGAGAFIEAFVTAVAGSYAYTVGAGGAVGGTASAGKAGADGVIIIEEYS